MGFWIRNIIFGTILVIIAYLFFANQDLLMSLASDEKPVAASVTENTTDTKTSDKMDTTPPPSAQTNPVTDKKSENKAATGLSTFYANINGDSDVDKPTIRNNIVYLPDPKSDLELLLNARKKVVRAYPRNWQGTTESRPFRLGETIFQKLSEYAKKDKLEVYWRLNRDYVVKDAFRINKNILKTALQLGQGISGHFQNGVSIYFCYQSRAIVVIEGTKSYLDEQCTLLKSNSGY